MYSAEIEYFAERAREFVTWCQTSHGGKGLALIQQEVLQMLSLIYAAGIHLPNIESRSAAEAVPAVIDEHLQGVMQNVQALPFQYYWGMLAPSCAQGNDAPVCGDLFDDFRDIYVDLISGLWYYERGLVEAAAFEWRFRFGAHLGRHVISAMHALHLHEPKGNLADAD